MSTLFSTGDGIAEYRVVVGKIAAMGSTVAWVAKNLGGGDSGGHGGGHGGGDSGGHGTIQCFNSDRRHRERLRSSIRLRFKIVGF